MNAAKRQPMPTEGAACRAERHELCTVPHSCPCPCHRDGTDLKEARS